jgi:hypothetical protein
MSDSEDDFVEVSGYQSSDSEWEKISVGYNSSSEEELVPAAPAVPAVPAIPASKGHAWPHEMVASYYQGNPVHALYPSNEVHLLFSKRVLHTISSVDYDRHLRGEVEHTAVTVWH